LIITFPAGPSADDGSIDGARGVRMADPRLHRRASGQIRIAFDDSPRDSADTAVEPRPTRLYARTGQGGAAREPRQGATARTEKMPCARREWMRRQPINRLAFRRPPAGRPPDRLGAEDLVAACCRPCELVASEESPRTRRAMDGPRARFPATCARDRDLRASCNPRPCRGRAGHQIQMPPCLCVGQGEFAVRMPARASYSPTVQRGELRAPHSAAD